MYCRVVRASRHALSIRAPGRCRDGRQPRARADRAARARRGRAVRRVHHARRRRVSPVRGQQRGRRGVGSRAPSPAVAPRRAPRARACCPWRRCPGASWAPRDTSERGETFATLVLTQGRDGTLKCWRASGADAPSPDPAWSVTSGSFHFCRFASARDVSTTNLRALAVVARRRPRWTCWRCSRTRRTRRRRTCGRSGCRLSARLGTKKAIRDLGRVAPRRSGGKAGHGDGVRLFVRAVRFGRSDGRRAARRRASSGRRVRARARWLCGTANASARTNATRTLSRRRFGARLGAPLWRERAHGDAVTSVAADTKRGGFVSASADGGVLRHTVRVVRETIREDESSVEKNETRGNVSLRVRRAQAHGGAQKTRSRRGR